MSLSWYNLTGTIPNGGENIILNYYFSVIDETKIINSFYNYNDICVDILLQITEDNLFDVTTLTFTLDGIFFGDTKLANILSDNSNYYNIYTAEGINYLDSPGGEFTYISNDISIVEISGPPTCPESTYEPIPISNICFPASTPIQTDQGILPIEKINSDIHTINNNFIVGITRTITQDEYLVCFLTNALAPNIPSKKTIISKNHKIWFNNSWVEAKKFINKFDGVTKIKYTGEILYNILLEIHDEVLVNNLICETLHPENIVAKLYKSNLDETYKNSLIIMMNDSILNEDSKTYKRILNILDEAELNINDEETNIIFNFPINSKEINTNFANYNYNLNCKISNHVKIQNKLDKYSKTNQITENTKNESEIDRSKIFFHSESNLALQNKLDKYSKTNQITENTKNEIIQKKIYINNLKEQKEMNINKEILKKELKKELQKELKKINNTKTFKYKVKKNLTYKSLNI